MRVLIIDNNMLPRWWGAEDLRKFAVENGATAFVRRAPHGDLPSDLRAYDKIVISGSKASCLEQSEWVTKLDDLIRKAVNEGKAILGICYGHQSIVRALGGVTHLRKAAQPEYGWTRIDRLAPSKLFEGLDDTFHSFSSHFEEVMSLPAGFKLLAKSAHCSVQGFEFGDKRVFGIQFHPERDLEDANESLAEQRKKGYGKILLNPEEGHRLYNPKIGQRIFSNFFSYE
jgi:GMP synthase-like glutamine amidotransferase